MLILLMAHPHLHLLLSSSPSNKASALCVYALWQHFHVNSHHANSNERKRETIQLSCPSQVQK